MTHQHTNALIDETSPYLLQHAHNPVDWLPWGEEALNKAQAEDKPLIISIGYSSCHWCHVMEHESFEDKQVAAYMNEHFVCIKVDREERPDVDQIYMDAVQLMTERGGWPLNCFALPDGRPFHGGTYFPKGQWMHVMEKVIETFEGERAKVEQYAQRLTEDLSAMDDMPVQSTPERFTDEAVVSAVGRWQKSFDREKGGNKGAPKFPMPNNLAFLLHYSEVQHDEEVRSHVLHTLYKLAQGGIYDQVGGGFARYSTDAIWKVPHFEKMLYDNGQLLSVYSDAYKRTGDESFARILRETRDFLAREMTDESGAFFSALDADSEGEEGKFYVWTKEELTSAAGNDLRTIEAYYHLGSEGKWEHNNYILMRQGRDEEIAASLQTDQVTMLATIDAFNDRLLKERSKRIRPGLDDKCLTSWNALTVSGLCKAYEATKDEAFLKLARFNVAFILEKQLRKDGGLWHSYKAGRSTINGYLEDYAFTIQALLDLHAATLDETYVEYAHRLLEYALEHFEQGQNGFFYFKSKDDAALIAQKAEIHDNVTPASNSVLATCMHTLGLLYGQQHWIDESDRMLANVEPNFNRYPTGHSQWMSLMLHRSHPFYEVAILGQDCEEKRAEMARHYLPATVLCGSKDEGHLPILQDRYVDGETRIYVCQSGACQLPVTAVDAALEQMSLRSDPGS